MAIPTIDINYICWISVLYYAGINNPLYICKNALVPVKGWKCNHLQVFYITSFFNISRATFDEMVRSKDHEIQVSIILLVYMYVCTNK